jgi:hypothetical protein
LKAARDPRPWAACAAWKYWDKEDLEEIGPGATMLEPKSTRHERKLDLKKVSRGDRNARTKVLRKMNADRRFRMQGAQRVDERDEGVAGHA